MRAKGDYGCDGTRITDAEQCKLPSGDLLALKHVLDCVDWSCGREQDKEQLQEKLKHVKVGSPILEITGQKLCPR
eukprot:2889028-Rhodomonas_salina.9